MQKNIYKLNESFSLSIIGILTYGFYGIMNPGFDELHTSLSSLFYFLFPVFSLWGYLYFFNKENYIIFKANAAGSFKYNFLILIFCLLLSFFSVFYINEGNSLTGDQLFYSNYGFIHSIKAVSILSSMVPAINNFDISFVIRGFSFVLILSFLFFSYVLFKIQNKNFAWFCFSVILVLVLTRLILSFLDGNHLVHAPLSGSYLLIFGSIFGLSSLVIQSAYYFIYILFSFFIIKKFAHYSSFLGFLLSISILTIPGLIFLSSIVEPSIWSIICFSIILCQLTDKNFSNYKLLVYLTVFFAFFRISSIFIIGPIFLHLIMNKKYNSTLNKKLYEYLKIFSPLIIFFPFLIFSFLNGSSATSGSSLSLKEILEISINGTMLTMYLDVISSKWLLMYLLLLFINLKSSFTYINIAFLCLLTLIYFSLNEEVIIFSKYRLEVFIPLLLSQAFLTIKIIQSRKMSVFYILLSFVLIADNTKNLYNFPDSCINNESFFRNSDMHYKFDYGCNYYLGVPYKFTDAFSYLKTKNAIGSTYMPGVNYNTFTFILNKASVSEYLEASNIWNDQDKLNTVNDAGRFGADPISIHEDMRIDHVLLGFTKNFEDLKSSLQKHGWTETFSSEHERFGTSVIVLARED